MPSTEHPKNERIGTYDPFDSVLQVMIFLLEDPNLGLLESYIRPLQVDDLAHPSPCICSKDDEIVQGGEPRPGVSLSLASSTVMINFAHRLLQEPLNLTLRKCRREALPDLRNALNSLDGI
jgi:hypothetical protein